MVGSIAYTAPLSYTPATTTGAAGSSIAAATAGNVKAATTDTSATSSAADTVTLSPNAQRLLAATANLTALENGGTNLAGVWNADFTQAASIGIDQVPAADAEIAKLPQSDPGHIAQATAAQAFVKANIAAAGTASGGQPVSAPNPFAGASTQTLTAIIGDKSGLYTGYEKAAAAYEYQAQQNSWVNQFGPGNPSNDNAAGKAVYYGKAISVYNASPPLIRASYPADYLASVTNLQHQYAAGRDDDTDPSVFGNSNGVKNPLLTLLESLTKTAASAAPTPKGL
jgi:hypothetical protein